LATLTLLTPTDNAGGVFIAHNYETYEVGVPKEIATKFAMLYMNSDNIQINFEDKDLKGIDSGLLENIAIKLECESKDVKGTLFPKKSTLSKVKNTLTKSAPPIIEEPPVVAEESTTEE
jgi:hypothetical protein